jgi:hypothetical protein
MLGQPSIFGQDSDENLPVPKFDLPAQQRMADELREAYLNLRRHLCDKPGESFETLLGKLIVAQHGVIWAASGEFDGANVLDPTLVEFTRSLQPFYVKKDEIRGFLAKAAREKPENAVEIQGIINRLDENSRRFAEAAGSKGFGRTILTVYALGAVLAELDKELPVAKLRKFGVPEGDYAGRRNRAMMALTDALGIIYPYAVRQINNRIPVAAPRFFVYYSTDYIFPGDIIKSFAATVSVSFDVAKLVSLQDETWHTYAKTEFDDAVQKKLRGNCQKETVRIMFVPSRRADAEKALKLLGDNGFEAKLQPVAENLVPTHKGKVYFQNKGNYERANIISGIVRNIENVNPDNGADGSDAPDYSLWIIDKKQIQPRNRAIRIMYAESRADDANAAARVLRENGFKIGEMKLGDDRTWRNIVVCSAIGSTTAEANEIAGLVSGLEKVVPQGCSDVAGNDPGGVHYVLWIVGKKGPTSNSVPNLSGVWTAAGYGCNGVPPTQTIRIEQNGNRITAFKIVGNACVKAGELTFRGTVAGNTFEVEFRSKQPDGTDDGFIRGTVRIVNPNRLELTRNNAIITLIRTRE